MKKEILVTCEVDDFLPLDSINDLQGDFKTRDDKDIERIIKSLIKYGISFPFFIWQDKAGVNYSMDGWGRKLGLMELRAREYTIPDIPIVYILAKNKAEAKQKMLRLNSRYGMITKGSVLQFVGDIEVDYDELAIPQPAYLFFDEAVKDVNKYFNEIQGDGKKDKTVKVCPHCGRILP